jgi:hypothetical protein
VRLALWLNLMRSAAPLGVGAEAGSELVTRNAVSIFGPGHSNGSAPLTSTGAVVNSAQTFTNESGAPITVGSVAFSGWTLRSTGITVVGNDFPITANIEYPVGGTTTPMTQGGSATITVPNGADVVTDPVTLATPIPVGATFKVNSSMTLTSGLKYTDAKHGISGVLSTAQSKTMSKHNLFVVGDSIQTNNNSAVATVAKGKCPVAQMSISGTQAATYALAGQFDKQVALAKKLGCTAIVSDFGTNDLAAGKTDVQVLASLNTLKNLAAAQGLKWYQMTILPRGGVKSVQPTAMSSIGTTLYATVPDASVFEVGRPYATSGGTPAAYNISLMCTAVNLGGNTVEFLFAGAADAAVTVIPAIGPKYGVSSRGMFNRSAWATGPGNYRSLLNAAIRGGNFDSYIEWADAFETSRDEGGYVVGGEHPKLLAPVSCSVTSIVNTTRFRSTYAGATSTGTGGGVIFTSGPNVGVFRDINGNTGNDITISGAPPNATTVGDNFVFFPGSIRATDDGTHPRVQTASTGGQQLLNDATSAWLDTLLAT